MVHAKLIFTSCHLDKWQKQYVELMYTLQSYNKNKLHIWIQFYPSHCGKHVRKFDAWIQI